MTRNEMCVPDDPERCPNEGISDQYWIYLMVSGVFIAIVYVFAARPVICYRFFRKTATHKNYGKLVKRSYTNNNIKFVKEVAMGKHPIGNIITIISLVINLGYFALYWRRTVLLSDICLDQFDPEWKFELGYTLYFLLYFCWRTFGGYDDLAFWMNLPTIVDLITIPHIFVSLARDRDWLGLRFFRILWFNHFVDLLTHLPASKNFVLLEAILSLSSYVITFWLTCSGAIHLLEVTGDPWHDFNNQRCDLTYQDYIYFIIVTISTVGYGDISPQTETGRFFIIVLIILSIFLVAFLIPAVTEVLSQWSPYSGSYIRITDVKHVIVTGHVTSESIKHFLRNFLHPDWNDDYTRVLFLHPVEPRCVVRTTIKSIHSVKYFKGSVLNRDDMVRVNMDTASAVIILSPNYSQNPESEDESNLMRIVSIKNAYNDTKIIAQVFQLQSLEQVLSLSHWDPNNDVIICKNKLKFGLMAQNCLCPGISTLLSNLVYPINDSDLVADLQWQLEYGKGAEHEVYRKQLPEGFIGKTYEYITKLCFIRYELLFIAVDSYSQNIQKYLTFLSPFGCTLKREMYGYFVAKSDKSVSNALQCLDEKFLNRTNSELTLDYVPLSTMEEQDQVMPQLTTYHNHNLYYHCTARDFQTALIFSTTVRDHIILCTFSLKESDRLSLFSFISPLRACSLKEHELKPVVIIGNKDCIRHVWCEIANFNDIFVIDGNPLDKGVLAAANVAQCSSCVILGSTASLDEEDTALIDKQPILCSLTLTAKGIKSCKSINRITELYKEENVRFLDLNDNDRGKHFVTSHTYAQGECMSNSIFDALVAVTYFNPGVTALFEKMVTGENNDSDTCSNSVLSCWPRFLQISLQEENFKRFEGLNFSELFAYLLEEKMLGIGISRIMENQPNSQHLKRYVISSPHNLPLKPDDIIFVLISK